jgi:galactonate dehydratase
MKITDIRSIIVGTPWRNWIFVKVETDCGIVGLGECTGGFQTQPIVSTIEELKVNLVGEDPCDINYINDKITKILFLGSAGPAMAGIDTACWDIRGRALGIPVYKLFGGKVRPSIRAYANGWYQGPRTPEFFAARAVEFVKMGYTALKFDPFGNAYMFLSRAEESYSMEIIRAVRNAVGPNVDLLIEAHDRFSVSQAIRIGKQLEEFNVMWYECPVLSTKIDELVEVARHVDIPVLAGERLRTLTDFGRLLGAHCIDLINPELLHVGGVSAMQDIYAIARAYGAYVSPHAAQSPFSVAVNTHLCVANTNTIIQECFDDSSVEWVDRLLQGWPHVIDGYLTPSEEPGFGVTLDEEEAAKHPYSIFNQLRPFEEGWEKRNSDD